MKVGNDISPIKRADSLLFSNKDRFPMSAILVKPKVHRYRKCVAGSSLFTEIGTEKHRLFAEIYQKNRLFAKIYKKKPLF